MLYFILAGSNYQILSQIKQIRARGAADTRIRTLDLGEDILALEDIFFQDPLFEGERAEEGGFFLLTSPTFLNWGVKLKARSLERLLEILSRIEGSGFNLLITQMITSEGELTRIRRNFKNLVKDKQRWIELTRALSLKEIELEIGQLCQRLAISIEPRARRELIEENDRNLDMIVSEIERLALTERRIDSSLLNKLGLKLNNDRTIFRQSLKLFSEPDLFAKRFEQLLEQGFSEINILAQISHNFRLAVRILPLLNDGLNFEEIAKLLDLKALRICQARQRCLKGCQSCLYRYLAIESAKALEAEVGFKRVNKVVRRLARTDREIKSSLLTPRLAIELLLFDLLLLAKQR